MTDPILLIIIMGSIVSVLVGQTIISKLKSRKAQQTFSPVEGKQ